MTAPCGRDAEGQTRTGYKVGVGEPEVRWRYGYKVIGCDPRLLGSGDRATAEGRAMATAADVSRQLIALGGPAEVEWWIQRVTITAEAVYEQPEGALLTEDEAAALLADAAR